MKQNRLGKSGVVVSELCMGTMTFGKHADKAMSFRIMDQAYEAGIDFFDTAEIYPVPPTADAAGISEEWLGEWMKTRDRSSVIVATKVAGAAHGWFNPPVRGGKAALDRVHIRQAVEGSLKKLQTDYIDLYQVHWADHGMRYEDTLEVLDELTKEGKIRLSGCSNEDSYGLMKSLWASDRKGISRYETVQNHYSILHRRCEDELAEVCRREQVSLLPYSPLAGGVVSGKYNEGKLPKDARFSAYIENGAPRQKAMAKRFVNEKSLRTTERLIGLAKELNMDVVTLALAWNKQQDFVASTIVGARHEDQLAAIFASAEVVLPGDVLAKIDAITDADLYPLGSLLGA